MLQDKLFLLQHIKELSRLLVRKTARQAIWYNFITVLVDH